MKRGECTFLPAVTPCSRTFPTGLYGWFQKWVRLSTQLSWGKSRMQSLSELPGKELVYQLGTAVAEHTELYFSHVKSAQRSAGLDCTLTVPSGAQLPSVLLFPYHRARVVCLFMCPKLLFLIKCLASVSKIASWSQMVLRVLVTMYSKPQKSKKRREQAGGDVSPPASSKY